jgi:hypothetical protein
MHIWLKGENSETWICELCRGQVKLLQGLQRNIGTGALIMSCVAFDINRLNAHIQEGMNKDNQSHIEYVTKGKRGGNQEQIERVLSNCGKDNQIVERLNALFSGKYHG